MSTIINATTTNGVVIQPDNSGSLVLQTNSGTTALTISTAQNATFAKSIILNGSTSGTVTVAAPAVAGTTTLTFPASTGTVMVNGPAFRAYRSGNQTLSAATATKIAFNAENFDTNSNFDSSTNYRFTPTVAGYYQVNASAGFTTGSGQLNIYKNGSNYQTGVEVTYNASLGGHFSINDLVYLNGSTDYIEIYTYLTSGTTLTSGDTNTAFSASMVRSA